MTSNCTKKERMANQSAKERFLEKGALTTLKGQPSRLGRLFEYNEGSVTEQR